MKSWLPGGGSEPDSVVDDGKRLQSLYIPALGLTTARVNELASIVQRIEESRQGMHWLFRSTWRMAAEIYT